MQHSSHVPQNAKGTKETWCKLYEDVVVSTFWTENPFHTDLEDILINPNVLLSNGFIPRLPKWHRSQLLAMWTCKIVPGLGCRHTSTVRVRAVYSLAILSWNSKLLWLLRLINSDFFDIVASTSSLELLPMSFLLSSCWLHFISVFPWVYYIPDIFTHFPFGITFCLFPSS